MSTYVKHNPITSGLSYWLKKQKAIKPLQIQNKETKHAHIQWPKTYLIKTTKRIQLTPLIQEDLFFRGFLILFTSKLLFFTIKFFFIFTFLLIGHQVNQFIHLIFPSCACNKCCLLSLGHFHKSM